MPILHRTRTLSALMPRYVERFRCIGPSCEDTCCAGWPVHIDKKTYKAYRNQTHPALQPLLARMRRLDDASDVRGYAILPTSGGDGACPAQQDGLCSVHATLGESYLNDTCQNYPRINRNVNGQQEQALSLSCIEAARMALLAEDAFEFVEAPISVREGTVHTTVVAGRISPQLMNEARIFCMNLMRTRELALWQRLAILGAFCEALERYLIGNAEQQAIQTIIDDFIGVIESGELVATLELIQPDHASQARVFATLWGVRGFTATSAFQQNLMQRIATGLGGDANGQVSAAALEAAYLRGLQRLEAMLASTPWLLENYLLNEMFANLFPVDGGNPYSVYLQLVARFGLLRLLLAAQCNAEDALPQLSTLTATVALQCRRFQHDRDYTTQVNRSLRESGWADLDKLYTLIRT